MPLTPTTTTTTSAAAAHTAPSLFQWLLNRPAQIKKQKMYLILSPDPWRIRPELVHESTKIKMTYARNTKFMLKKGNPTVTCLTGTKGRMRPIFRPNPVDYPEWSDWFGIVNPLPQNQNLKPLDIPPLLHEFTYKYIDSDWRTEEGTKRGVEGLEGIVKDLLRYHNPRWEEAPERPKGKVNSKEEERGEAEEGGGEGEGEVRKGGRSGM
ncbi:hypothetical protein BDN72DRAFT_960287 [Pluteus cervinus]|uniref:Uncharacterized protein n=1 Tax=Pluteus cervinus TaxID=181527 RepID=A0ACD3ARU3_9AGAR|nr:hypothetical protein BDN72DRAFT_960287 [Pluteus cervinus]